MSVVKATSATLSRPFRAGGWDLVCVGLGAACLSGIAYAYYHSAGVILLYGDAVSRLNIARRVFDSLDPGLVQLGNIWPPVPALAMLPLIWIEPLWRSGLAGSIPSMAAFVATSLYLYGIGRCLTGNKLGGVAACLVLVLNPNMLYLQSTPMSESLMLLTVVGAAYHLVVWLQQEKTLHLTAAAAWIFVSTLTRYEGWVLVAGGALIVMAFTLARYRDPRRTEALTLMFLAPAVSGALLWLVYSAVIFGDPLNFATGFGTARFDANVVAEQGLLGTKWDLWNTMLAFGWAVVDMIGLPVLTVAAAGLAVALGARVFFQRSEHSVALVAILFLSLPAFFVVVSMFAGNAVIFGAHGAPAGWMWNTRYGVQVLPAVAVLAAYPARIHRYAGVLLVAVLISLAALTYGRGGSLTIDSAGVDRQVWVEANFPVLRGLQPLSMVELLTEKTGLDGPQEAARWLRAHHAGERVLVSAFASDPFMFHAGLPLKTFVYEGAQPYWDDEFEDPGTWTGWVVMRKGATKDLVALELGDRIEISPRFELAFENDSYRIFKVVSPVARPEEVGQ